MRKAEAQRAAEIVVLIAAGVALGLVLNQNGCYRCLCQTWFTGNPEGELDCLMKVEDVTFGERRENQALGCSPGKAQRLLEVIARETAALVG